MSFIPPFGNHTLARIPGQSRLRSEFKDCPELRRATLFQGREKEPLAQAKENKVVNEARVCL